MGCRVGNQKPQEIDCTHFPHPRGTKTWLILHHLEEGGLLLQRQKLRLLELVRAGSDSGAGPWGWTHTSPGSASLRPAATGQAHLNAVQQLAHAPVGVSLDVAQHFLRHAGDVHRVHILLFWAAPAWKDEGQLATGSTQHWEEAARDPRRCQSPPHSSPPPTGSCSLTPHHLLPPF